MGLPKHYDAFFVVTSHHKESFSGRLHKAKDTSVQYAIVTDIEPHRNRFLYESLLDAPASFMEEDYADWRPIALNQLLDDIAVIDFAASIPVTDDVLQRAKQWLRTCRPWNEHQLKAIEDMHCAKGRLQLICGVAGTGKTTLQIAQAIFFVKLGGRALCTATGNSNADHWAREGHRFIGETSDTRLRIYRLYAASKGVNIRDLCKAQATHKRAGHGRGGRVSSLRELMFKVLGDNKAEAIDFSVEKGVLDEAEIGELSLLKKSNGTEREVDAWQKFRDYLTAVKDDKVKWGRKDEMNELSKIYEACKGHLVGLADIIITTNGNPRCHELVKHWGKAEELYGVANGKSFPPVAKVKALGVFRR